MHYTKHTAVMSCVNNLKVRIILCHDNHHHLNTGAFITVNYVFIHETITFYKIKLI